MDLPHQSWFWCDGGIAGASPVSLDYVNESFAPAIDESDVPPLSCVVCLGVPLIPAVLPACKHVLCLPCALKYLMSKVTMTAPNSFGDLCCPMDRAPIPVVDLPPNINHRIPLVSSTPKDFIEDLFLDIVEWMRQQDDAGEVLEFALLPYRGEVGAAARGVIFQTLPRRAMAAWGAFKVKCANSRSGCDVAASDLSDYLASKHFMACGFKEAFCPVGGCPFSRTPISPQCERPALKANDLENHMRQFASAHVELLSATQQSLLSTNTSLLRLVDELKVASYRQQNDIASLEFQLRAQAQTFHLDMQDTRAEIGRLRALTNALMLSAPLLPECNDYRQPPSSSLSQGTSIFQPSLPVAGEVLSLSCGWLQRRTQRQSDTAFEVLGNACFRSTSDDLREGGESGCRGWATLKSTAMVVLSPDHTTAPRSAFRPLVRVRFVSRSHLSIGDGSTVARRNLSQQQPLAAGGGLAATRVTRSGRQSPSEERPTGASHLEAAFRSGAVMVGVMSNEGLHEALDCHLGKIRGCLALQSTGFVWNGDTNTCSRLVPQCKSDVESTTVDSVFGGFEFSSAVYLRLRESSQLGCAVLEAASVPASTPLPSLFTAVNSAFVPLSYLTCVPRMFHLGVSLGSAMVGVEVDVVHF